MSDANGSANGGGGGTTLRDKYETITRTRVLDPGAIQRAADARTKATVVPADGRLMIIACDHPARGANGVGNRPLAMGNRVDLLEREPYSPTVGPITPAVLPCRMAFGVLARVAGVLRTLGRDGDAG